MIYRKRVWSDPFLLVANPRQQGKDQPQQNYNNYNIFDLRN